MEDGGGAEGLKVKKVEQGEEVFEAILDGGSGDTPAAVRVECFRGFELG